MQLDLCCNQDCRENFFHLGVGEGLEKEIGGAQMFTLCPVFRIIRRCEHDYRNMRRFLICSYLGQAGPSIHQRHIYIKEDNVRKFALAQVGKGIDAVLGREADVTFINR